MRERLPPGPDEAIDRHRSLSFSLDGRNLQAYEGDTVGSAMAANEVHVTGRSFKYHRPRGLLCMTGNCPNCLVTIDGIPNVRACTEPVRDGMVVERQNFRVSAEHDVLSLTDRLSFMLPPGFYYKVFHRPRSAWRRVEPLIRHMAGLGKVPRKEDHLQRERMTLHTDVLVVGGGPAGLAAASEAARSGARTIVLEERPEAGGHLLPSHRAEAESLAAEATDAGAELLLSTPAFGTFDGRLVAAAGPDCLYRIRAGRVVFATGAVEQPAVFPNNDLPGVMLAGAVERLVTAYGVLPGRRAVVLSASEAGHRAAALLADAGARVTIVDLRRDPPPASPGIEMLSGSTVRRAEGRRRVSVAIVGPVDQAKERQIQCDLIVVAGFRAPSTNLLAQAGATLDFDDAAQAFLPVALPDWAHAAGEVAGARSLETVLAQGRLAGLDAAGALGFEADASSGRLSELRARATAAADHVVLPPEVGKGRGKQFACLCMDVTEKELGFAAKEGFDSPELLKRYTAMSMGPCQGKACMLSSRRLWSAATGRPAAASAPTTSRPPWTPVPLGVLASDHRTPRRETSIHDLHAEAGAEFIWGGDWRRPEHYGDPRAEAEAVRERVGAIDVSPLGKFRVKGPDAVELLERLCPNRFADLKIGRIRYEVMLNDEGVIFDDGTVCRLGEDEFFVTVTTGNTAAVERWIELWLTDWRLDVRVLNATSAFAAVNVAGPYARRVMERLTEMDVSAEALPYLGSARGIVAGVPALILRIGFVGELSYEIHFPSGYGEHLWRRILEAGADLGIRPFGLEAQRILRLEKFHILVGQDTDAESGPYEAGLGWTVKLDKADFVGKRSLLGAGEGGARDRLVGFTMDGEEVPPEGSAIVDDGRWVGRVTSSRRSPATGAVIGLGWVPAARAVEGERIRIRFAAGEAEAAVTLRPFYDPEGARLLS